MKSVAIHAVLALVGLAMAYQTWTREEEAERPPGEVEIASCELDEIESIEVETKTHLIHAAPFKVGEKTRYWFTSQRKKDEKKEEPAAAADGGTSAEQTAEAPDAPDAPSQQPESPHAQPSADKPVEGAPADGGTAAEADKPPEPKQARTYDPDAPVAFLASEKLDPWLEGLSPLRAVRGVGDISKDKLEQFGFDDVETRLRVACGGQKVELEVGGRTYGTGHRYVRRPGQSAAFLLEGGVVNDIQSAQYKFMQSDLHSFQQTDVDEARVAAGGKEKKLLHRNRQTQNEARWVDAAAPDRRNELFQTWFQRVSRLKVKSYMPRDAAPGSDIEIEASAPVPVGTIEYLLEGKPKGKLELVRVDTEQGAFYYARSEATVNWVTMYDSLAKQVEEDMPMIVGAEEAPATSPSVPESAPPASPE